VILAARSAGEVRNRRNYPPDFGAPPGYKSGPATFSSHLIQLAAIAVTRGRESAAEAAINPPMRRRHVVWMPRRALSIVSGISLWRLATGGQVCARRSSNLGRNNLRSVDCSLSCKITGKTLLPGLTPTPATRSTVEIQVSCCGPRDLGTATMAPPCGLRAAAVGSRGWKTRLWPSISRWVARIRSSPYCGSERRGSLIRESRARI
jgi:hypothetical protein